MTPIPIVSHLARSLQPGRTEINGILVNSIFRVVPAIRADMVLDARAYVVLDTRVVPDA